MMLFTRHCAVIAFAVAVSMHVTVIARPNIVFIMSDDHAAQAISAYGSKIITTPNLSSWHNLFALLLGYQPLSGPHLTHFSDTDLGLVRRLREERCQELAEQDTAEVQGDSTMYRHIVVAAYRSLQRLFTGIGFEIEELVAAGYYPLPPALERIMTRLDRMHASHLILKVRKPRG